MRSSLFQVARYGSVGLLAAAVHYLVASGLFLVIDPFVANGFGYLSGFLVSYFGHQRFTFQLPKEDRQHRRHLPRFVCAWLVGLFASQVVLWASLEAAVPKSLALLMAIATVPPVLYLLSRFWVYR